MADISVDNNETPVIKEVEESEIDIPKVVDEENATENGNDDNVDAVATENGGESNEAPAEEDDEEDEADADADDNAEADETNGDSTDAPVEAVKRKVEDVDEATAEKKAKLDEADDALNGDAPEVVA